MRTDVNYTNQAIDSSDTGALIGYQAQIIKKISSKQPLDYDI